MKRVLMAGLIAGLAACAHGAEETPARVAPKTMTEAQAKDWAYAPGEALNAEFAADVRTLLLDAKRPDAILALGEAGYECTYGEAHEDYPEPAAQCTRSFASRACQFDWEVFLTTDPAVPGEVDTVDAAFRRDCVGLADDWPEPVKSAIDDQLAPPPPLPAEPN